MIYGLTGRGAERNLTRLMAILTNLYASTESLTVGLSHSGVPAEDYLGALLDRSHAYSRRVCMMDGDLRDFVRVE